MSTRSKIVAYCRKQLGCAYSYTPSGGKEGSAYNCSYLSTCAYKAAETVEDGERMVDCDLNYLQMYSPWVKDCKHWEKAREQE